MNRIHLGQVPRKSDGEIKYTAIRSVMIKIMVAEEELEQLQRWYKRMGTPNDPLYTEDSEKHIRANHKIKVLEGKLEQWKRDFEGTGEET
ncbi:hypothetical protein [Parendozoicomonas haliclonae]|uniref:Uncharacterized protein n=1 Tax=Parendozoicomonas haliclonae TaxID=1960125 RepID=A0A1X7AE60_9GAMM|nr:hypothetical protein [Parendozoicomonas haliclonae]SMA33519.1 hypothetical protein EHSB41UT_00293 [Parendozoicomonas haliclonae]